MSSNLFYRNLLYRPNINILLLELEEDFTTSSSINISFLPGLVMQRRLLSGHNIGIVQTSEWNFPWSRSVLVLFPSHPGCVLDWLLVPDGVQKSFMIFMFSARNSPPWVCSCWRRISRSPQRDNRRRARWCFPPGGSSLVNIKPPLTLLSAQYFPILTV